MTTHDENVPRALREVWAWKDAIYQEVKHLPRDQMLRAILDNARKAAFDLGMTTNHGVPLMARESAPKYGGKKSEPK